jgi:hypothetical protein
VSDIEEAGLAAREAAVTYLEAALARRAGLDGPRLGAPGPA